MYLVNNLVNNLCSMLSQFAAEQKPQIHRAAAFHLQLTQAVNYGP